jgi:hypothetical protein
MDRKIEPLGEQVSTSIRHSNLIYTPYDRKRPDRRRDVYDIAFSGDAVDGSDQLWARE